MPTIRGSSITSSSASSYTLPFSALLPAVPQAGDDIFLYVAGGWQANAAPAGWTTLDAQPGSNWNGSIYNKRLTSGDITTGSVTITMAGSFDAVLALVCYVGAVTYRTPTTSRNGSGSSSIALAAPSTVQTGDHVMLFGSNRANSVDTVDKGTGVLTISGGTGGAASGVLTEYVAPGAGAFTANFAYATAGIGNYQAAVPVANPVPSSLWSGGVVRETLGSGTAQLRTSTVVREALTSGVVAAINLQAGGVVRETLGSGTAQLKVSAVVRETLISSKSGRRRYVLVY